jgi:IS30 family transposase
VKNKYKQLDKEQRYQIGVLFEIGKCKSEIADIIGVHKSTMAVNSIGILVNVGNTRVIMYLV